MEKSTDLICWIQNRSGLEIRVLDKSGSLIGNIPNRRDGSYKLVTPRLQWKCEDSDLSVSIDGSSYQADQPTHNMCFCIDPNTSIGLVIDSSLTINLLQLVKGQGADVKCGEGVP